VSIDTVAVTAVSSSPYHLTLSRQSGAFLDATRRAAQYPGDD